MKLKKISLVVLLVIGFLSISFVNAAIDTVTVSDVNIDIVPTKDGRLSISFKLSKDIDLSKNKSNVKIEYFSEGEDGELIPIKNTLEENFPLVKDKTWSGYLWSPEGQFSTGDDNKQIYIDLIPANLKLTTLLKKGVAADGDSMDYFELDWTDKNLKIVIKITATDEFGHGESVEVRSYNDEIIRTTIIDTTPSVYGFINDAAEKVFTEGKETEINLGIQATTIENLGYDAVKILTAVTKPNGGELTITGINKDTFKIAKDYNKNNVIKVLPSISGTYTIKIDLVNVNDNSKVIATKTITLEVNEKTIVEKIKDSSNDKKTEIDLSKSTAVSAEAFETAKENKVDLTFNVKENNKLKYSWTFASTEIKDTMNLDLGLKIGSSEKKEEIEKITKDSNVLYLSFTHHGDLPAPATIKTFVGDKYSDGATLKLYYYNEANKKVELISEDLVVKDGYVSFVIEHCSVYLLKEKNNNPVTGDINVIGLVSISLLSLAGIVYIKSKK
ncbi:MAG: hypothetical protein PHR25_06675 [Clostridia bacterium]|nr:hypothetical protein [Clostridia bacterium]MDD4376439.1 hypothetical protein [Clostridia bacterium]